MGLNRQMRRQQERQTMRDWMRMPEKDRMVRMAQNGITSEYADSEYKRGVKDGFQQGANRALKVVYAACVLELLDAGNTKDEALSFLKAVDGRALISIDEKEDIDEVFRRTGVRLELKEDFDRVQGGTGNE